MNDDQERRNLMYKGLGVYSTTKRPQQKASFRLPCRGQCKNHCHKPQHVCLFFTQDGLQVAPPPRASKTRFLLNTFPSKHPAVRKLNAGRSFVCMQCATNIYNYIIKDPLPLFRFFARRVAHDDDTFATLEQKQMQVWLAHPQANEDMVQRLFSCMETFPQQPWNVYDTSKVVVDLVTTPPKLVRTKPTVDEDRRLQHTFDQCFLDLFQYCTASAWKGPDNDVSLGYVADHMLSLNVGQEYNETYNLMWLAVKYASDDLKRKGFDTKQQQWDHLKTLYDVCSDEDDAFRRVFIESDEESDEESDDGRAVKRSRLCV